MLITWLPIFESLFLDYLIVQWLNKTKTQFNKIHSKELLYQLARQKSTGSIPQGGLFYFGILFETKKKYWMPLTLDFCIPQWFFF